MGLDGVELILAVEDAFQITITDEEAGTVVTVGDLHDLVIAKLHSQDCGRCLTSAAFYRTRQGIAEPLGIAQRDIRPSTSLDAILPRSGRRQSWRRIQEVANLNLPALQHPRWIQLTLVVTGIALATATGVQLHLGVGGTLLLSFFGLFVGSVLIRLSPPLAFAFPNRSATVGDLSRDVLALNHARLVSQVGNWNKKDVWEALCRVVVKETSVEPERIHRESLIVDDLGID
jgi:hypothetical protein